MKKKGFPKVLVVIILSMVAGVLISQALRQWRMSGDRDPTKLSRIQATTEGGQQNQTAEIEASDYGRLEEGNAQPSATAETDQIDDLTAESVVVDYIRKHSKLPDYYVRKGEARNKGWVPSRNNLCEELPGKAIGGDEFNNREKQLPEQKGRKYYEADLDYNCGRRGPNRLIFSNDGLIFVTRDHYNTFEKK